MKSSMTSTALALVLALGTGPAIAAAEWTFSDVDADNDLELSGREFEQVSRGAFSAWDRDQNQRISGDELYQGLYVSWDADQDGMLTRDEYDRGYLGWFGDGNEVAYDDLDANDDAMLEQNEFASGIRNSGQLGNWNVDGDGVDWQTFHTALYGIYDADRSDTVSQAEYDAYGNQRMAGTNTAMTNTAMNDDAGVDAAQTTAAVGNQTVTPQEVVTLSEWNTDDLYVNGLSVDDMIDDADVYGVNGEEIGSIENVIFSNDGRVISVVAEVGGFWDMFDTHVNVPWDEVRVNAEGEIAIPVTEENVEDYSTWKTGYLTAGEAGGNVEVVDDDLETGPALFRATDLIGDYSRIRDGDSYRNYGYINDLIIRDGQLQAVVVSPDSGYGMTRGAYAYPYYGWGWNAGRPYYDMPYGAGDVADVGALDYERFEYAE